MVCRQIDEPNLTQYSAVLTCIGVEREKQRKRERRQSFISFSFSFSMQVILCKVSTHLSLSFSLYLSFSLSLYLSIICTRQNSAILCKVRLIYLSTHLSLSFSLYLSFSMQVKTALYYVRLGSSIYLLTHSLSFSLFPFHFPLYTSYNNAILRTVRLIYLSTHPYLSFSLFLYPLYSYASCAFNLFINNADV